MKEAFKNKDAETSSVLLMFLALYKSFWTRPILILWIFAGIKPISCSYARKKRDVWGRGQA